MWQFILQHLWELAFTGISGALTAAYRRLTKRIKATGRGAQGHQRGPAGHPARPAVSGLPALHGAGLD